MMGCQAGKQTRGEKNFFRVTQYGKIFFCIVVFYYLYGGQPYGRCHQAEDARGAEKEAIWFFPKKSG